ncbi:MAG TPA: LPS export ABC transporter periplasmic protein LptC, partial [Rhodocyclaceae bacterium]
DPDYIVDHFTVRRFDETGTLQHFLVGEKMLHYPDDDSTEVLAPRLTYFRTPPVHVSSNTAWLDKDGKHVKLEGNVRVIRDGLDGSPSTEIDTSVLYAIPDDEFAHTDAPVTITQGQSVMHGSGMETNDKTQISILYGRASGTIYKKQTDAAHGKN